MWPHLQNFLCFLCIIKFFWKFDDHSFNFSFVHGPFLLRVLESIHSMAIGNGGQNLPPLARVRLRFITENLGATVVVPFTPCNYIPSFMKNITYIICCRMSYGIIIWLWISGWIFGLTTENVESRSRLQRDSIASSSGSRLVYSGLFFLKVHLGPALQSFD